MEPTRLAIKQKNTEHCVYRFKTSQLDNAVLSTQKREKEEEVDETGHVRMINTTGISSDATGNCQHARTIAIDRAERQWEQ